MLCSLLAVTNVMCLAFYVALTRNDSVKASFQWSWENILFKGKTHCNNRTFLIIHGGLYEYMKCILHAFHNASCICHDMPEKKATICVGLTLSLLLGMFCHQVSRTQTVFHKWLSGVLWAHFLYNETSKNKIYLTMVCILIYNLILVHNWARFICNVNHHNLFFSPINVHKNFSF